MSTKKNKTSILKKLIDKGIDKLSELEREYVQGIDYEDDPLYQKEIEKKEKEEEEELFKQTEEEEVDIFKKKGGQIKKKRKKSKKKPRGWGAARYGNK